MRKLHIAFALIIFISTFFASYISHSTLTNFTIQNLITAFAIFFGFYLTTISTIYNSEYLKKLNKDKTAKITLYKYFWFSGLWSIFSICFIFVLSFKSELNEYNELVFNLNQCINQSWISLVISISSVNILFVIIIFRMLLVGLVENSQENSF